MSAGAGGGATAGGQQQQQELELELKQNEKGKYLAEMFGDLNTVGPGSPGWGNFLDHANGAVRAANGVDMTQVVALSDGGYTSLFIPRNSPK
jgi:hypothetical protein